MHDPRNAVIARSDATKQSRSGGTRLRRYARNDELEHCASGTTTDMNGVGARIIG
jgi:hypothetical protein